MASIWFGFYLNWNNCHPISLNVFHFIAKQKKSCKLFRFAELYLFPLRVYHDYDSSGCLRSLILRFYFYFYLWKENQKSLVSNHFYNTTKWKLENSIFGGVLFSFHKYFRLIFRFYFNAIGSGYCIIRFAFLILFAIDWEFYGLWLSVCWPFIAVLQLIVINIWASQT